MIVAEAAVAVILLAGAGMMIESFRDLTSANPGFDPKNVMTVRLLLPAATYDAERALRFYRRGRATHRGLARSEETWRYPPALPLLNNMEVRFKTEGAEAREEAERPSAPYAGVGPDYFRTLGIPLKQRTFLYRDGQRDRAAGGDCQRSASRPLLSRTRIRSANA